ncbi:MAG TPA: DinB family protein [Candidatus Sulfotelmatobacter sp.]|nr:DinB family protein [Candidatus Sulfotelmatobacter sp.]
MNRTLLVVSLVVSAMFAQAQNTAAKASGPSAAPTKDPVATSLRLVLQRFQNNTIGAVEAMPADKFSYKPTADQSTFAHLAAHIANSNNFFCSKAADVTAPKVDEPKETDSKDQLVTAVKASFDFCGDALSKMDDSKLGDTVELFGGRQVPRAVAALGLASSLADHYGAAAMYLRLNGILPPSAQPKK